MAWYEFFNKFFNSKEFKNESKLHFELPQSMATKNVADSIYPEFYLKIKMLLEKAEKENLNVGIHSGFRSFDDQAKLYAKGRTSPGQKVTNAQPGKTWHNYGLAVDIVFKDARGWTWDDKHDWKRLGEIGKECGLEWGGDWKKLKDMPHFQLTKGLKINDALALYKSGGLEKVWSFLDEKKNI